MIPPCSQETIVWILSTVRKTIQLSDHEHFANDRLEFPVTEYDGTKSILLSTRTVIGGKNPFMGIAYVVVGGVCVLLGALFTVAYLIRPRYVLWPSVPIILNYRQLLIIF